MAAHNYVHRTVTVTSADETMSVSRTRTSEGKAFISMKVGTTQIDFGTEGYEQRVDELISMLTEIREHGCTLPPVGDVPQ